MKDPYKLYFCKTRNFDVGVGIHACGGMKGSGMYTIFGINRKLKLSVTWCCNLILTNQGYESTQLSALNACVHQPPAESVVSL